MCARQSPFLTMFEFFVGVAVTIVGGGILALAGYLLRRRADRITLEAKISFPGPAALVDIVGCASVIVSVHCVGMRAAPLRRVMLLAEGVDLLPALERAFGTSFDHVPAVGAPDPALAMDLLPLTAPGATASLQMVRGDRRDFALPTRAPLLDFLMSRPPASVAVVAELNDGARHPLVPGSELFELITQLVRSWKDIPQSLRIPMEFRVEVSASRPPAPGPVGKRNPYPFVLDPSGNMPGGTEPPHS